MLETLKTVQNQILKTRFFRWLTAPVYERAWEEGLAVGYKIAERLISHEATNAERRRVNEILIRERARLLDLEEAQWKGYSAELLDEVEALMTLVGQEEVL